MENKHVFIVNIWIHHQVSFTHIHSVEKLKNVCQTHGTIIIDGAQVAGYKVGNLILKKIVKLLKQIMYVLNGLQQ